MANTLTVLQSRLFTQLRSASVATAAGINSTLWAATDYPHVFYQDSGFRGHRSRGRLPFIEFWIADQTFDKRWDIGGTISTNILLRVWVGGSDNEVADELAYDILMASVAAIRDDATDNLTVQGRLDVVTPLTQGAWGHSRDCTMTIDLTYDVSTYERA